MNGFLIFSLATVLSLTLIKPFCVIANNPIPVTVQNSFRDGRLLSVYCFSSNKRSNSFEVHLHKTLQQDEEASWIENEFQFDEETLATCKVEWTIRVIITVKYKFKAFKGSWSHGDFIRNHINGALGYYWMFNETGFFGFVYSLQIFRRVATMQQLMSSASFIQPVNIFVTNGFADGRTVGILSSMNKGDGVHRTIATGFVEPGAVGSWAIHKFKEGTINTCKVGWEHTHDQKILYLFEFEAFVGSWSIDISSTNPSTAPDRYEWLLNETGIYRRNLDDGGYELERALYL